MAAPKYISPFPPLELTPNDKREICRITKKLVGEVVDGYERFLYNDKSALNPLRWSLVRERDDVRVYHDKFSGGRTQTNDQHQPQQLNVLLTVGTVTGTLDDAMYGMLNHTTDLMRVKTAYVKDTIVNCAVLDTIQAPTTEKPFRSMTIKWGVKGLPLHIRAMTRNRDMVFVESMGTKTLSNGEEIGFQLLHSIDFKYTQPLPSYVRGNISICSVWRKTSPEKTEVYMKSFIDGPDRLLAPLVIRTSADALVSVGRFMFVAQMKKLAWLMRRRSGSDSNDPTNPNQLQPQSQRKTSIASITNSRSHNNSQPGDSSNCAICGVHSHSTRQGAKSACTICSRTVCSSCRVRRELCYVSADKQLVENRVGVCVPCLTVADKANATEVARDEISMSTGGVHEPTGQLSELVKVSSVARFSYTPLSHDCLTSSSSSMSSTPRHHRGSKRRSMTLVAPLKSVLSSVAMSSSVFMTPRGSKKSNAWVHP